MAHATAHFAARSFDSPDEMRQFEGKGGLALVELAGHLVSRATYEPGWTWSDNVKPLAGTDSCETFHLGYCVKGRMKVRMDNGDEQMIGAGDVAVVPPGHTAEVVGDEACEWIDFGDISDYARR